MNPLAALLAADPDQVILTVRNGEIFISFVEARVQSARLAAVLGEPTSASRAA